MPPDPSVTSASKLPLLWTLSFPFGSHRRYAEEVVATILSGLQNRTIQAT
jgi:hypothetical protein